MENRSKAILGMEDSAFARSLFKSMGYTDSELKEGKPLIGIANTWNTLVPGHYNLDKVAEYVKNGIYAAGGTAVEFGTIAACDGVIAKRKFCRVWNDSVRAVRKVIGR